MVECNSEQVGETETYGNPRVVTVADHDGSTFELLEVPEEID